MGNAGDTVPNEPGVQRPPAGALAPDSLPRHRGDIVSRTISGETILVPIRSRPGELDDIFTLNDVATRVWDLIDGSRSITDISRAISATYDVSQEQALEDTRELVSRLHEAQVVTLPGDPGRQD